MLIYKKYVNMFIRSGFDWLWPGLTSFYYTGFSTWLAWGIVQFMVELGLLSKTMVFE